jgi:hypothetical protein
MSLNGAAEYPRACHRRQCAHLHAPTVSRARPLAPSPARPSHRPEPEHRQRVAGTPRFASAEPRPAQSEAVCSTRLAPGSADRLLRTSANRRRAPNPSAYRESGRKGLRQRTCGQDCCLWINCPGPWRSAKAAPIRNVAQSSGLRRDSAHSWRSGYTEFRCGCIDRLPCDTN